MIRAACQVEPDDDTLEAASAFSCVAKYPAR